MPFAPRISSRKSLRVRDAPAEDESYEDSVTEAERDEDCALSDQLGADYVVSPSTADDLPRSDAPNQVRQKSISSGRPSSKRQKTDRGDSKVESDRTKKLIRKQAGKKLHAGNEDTVVNFLGHHVDMARAMRLRDLWFDQIHGPASSLITKHELSQSLPCLYPALQDASSQCEVITDLSLYKDHLPLNRNVLVEHIRPSNLESVPAVLSGTECYDFGAREAACRSMTIHTGLSNRSVAWAPTTEQTQYLAVGGTKDDAKPSSLFRMEALPGSIQLWRCVLQSPDRVANLAIVYLHDFGHIWQLRWCPALSSDSNLLGLLAGLFGDGSVKIWHVYEPAKSEHYPVYRYLRTPAYCLRLPESPSVSFDWLSDVRIVVGCANGMSATWDLSKDSSLPFVVGQAHTCYINNVVSCAPSVSDTVLSTGWDCEVKLSDIKLMESNFLIGNKERTPTYVAAWSDMLNSAVVGEDLHWAKILSMRTGLSINIGSMTGTVTALATHASHPFLALGDSSGLVKVINLYRKILFKKKPQNQRKIYQLELGTAENKYRFTENYEVEELFGKTVDTRSTVTDTYPHEINITSLAWNGNPGYEALLASCSNKFVRIDELVVER